MMDEDKHEDEYGHKFDWETFDVAWDENGEPEGSVPYCRVCYRDTLGYRISDDEIAEALRQEGLRAEFETYHAERSGN